LADIFSFHPDGSDVRQLTSDPSAMDAHPAWSADGRRLVFSRQSGGEWNVWTMEADGSGQRPLTSGPLIDIVPSFSPDGRYVVFDSTNATTGITTLIRINSTKGGNRTGLIPADQMPAEASYMGPKVSPDGALLAFASGAGNPPGAWDLWVMEGWLEAPNGPGVSLRRLITGANNSFSRSWSPDGSSWLSEACEAACRRFASSRWTAAGSAASPTAPPGPTDPSAPAASFPALTAM
jgi:TolB protein